VGAFRKGSDVIWNLDLGSIGIHRSRSSIRRLAITPTLLYAPRQADNVCRPTLASHYPIGLFLVLTVADQQSLVLSPSIRTEFLVRTSFKERR
jgi:hypothetical protein